MNDLINHVQTLVEPIYESLDCWVHKWSHIEKVSYYINILAKKEQIDPTPCIIAAYCHDLGRLEEEKLKKENLHLPHALLSIEPTCKILNEIGISGTMFGEIIEAITVHSYRVYEGSNKVAKVLQDADKMAGFGFLGIFEGVKYFSEEDYIDPKEVIINKNNREKLKELIIELSKKIEKSALEKALKGLKWKSEWYEMFHTKSSKEIIKKEYEDFEWARNFLSGFV